MKKIIGIFLCLSLASCEQIAAPNDNQYDQPHQLRTDTYPDPDSTFYVQNNTHVNVGWVTIHMSDNSNAYINVPDSGTYSATLSHSPITSIINQQSLSYGNYSWIVINQHVGIHENWTTPNIVVIDQSEEH
jgi:hypothetical protein